MEGDLLEVMMDEVQQLWQLLQLDTEYLSVFDTSPAKLGRSAPVKEEVNVHNNVHVYTCIRVCLYLYNAHHVNVNVHVHVPLCLFGFGSSS